MWFSDINFFLFFKRNAFLVPHNWTKILRIGTENSRVFFGPPTVTQGVGDPWPKGFGTGGHFSWVIFLGHFLESLSRSKLIIRIQLCNFSCGFDCQSWLKKNDPRKWLTKMTRKWPTEVTKIGYPSGQWSMTYGAWDWCLGVKTKTLKKFSLSKNHTM